MVATSTHKLIGQRVFGGYTITRKVGEGGMGAVYVAENVELNKKLAVKILLPEWSRNEQIVERFLAEARAASAINHPNIIDIIDASQLADGSHYILMEYLEGNSLRAFAQSWGALAMDMALAIIAQVCSALDATHLRGIVHRDLKPANLFVAPTPTNQLFTKVLDFGIAKLNDARLAGNIKTGTNAIAGTPAYMSPEQARATRDVDHRSDIYSLGVIIYELLAGTRPYAAESIGELAYQQATARPPPLKQHRPDLPDAWCNVVEAALAIEPGQRPDTTRELATALVDATPNGKNIAMMVAPLLFTNAPRSAETFKYQGNYGLGIVPSEPQQVRAASAGGDLGSANTMAARSGPGPVTPISRAPSRQTRSAAGASDSMISGATALPDSGVGLEHTLSAMPEPARPAPLTSQPPGTSQSPADRQPVPAVASQPVAHPITTLSGVASESSVRHPAGTSAGRSRFVLAGGVVAVAAVAGVTIALLASGGKSSSKSAAASSQEVDAAAASAPRAPATTTVTINSEPPGATVFIDDVQRDGVTPLRVQLEVGKRVVLRAEKDGYKPQRQPLTVAADTPAPSLRLEQVPAVARPEPAAAEPAKPEPSKHSRRRRRHRRRPTAPAKPADKPVDKVKPADQATPTPTKPANEPTPSKPFDPDDPAGS